MEDHVYRPAPLGTWVLIKGTWYKSDARFMMLGGEPIDGPRFIWWNFVSSRKERIEQAKADWKLWDEARRDRYTDLRKARNKIAEDAYQTTRWILAMDRDLPHPEGTEVRAVAAYHDLDEGKTDLGLKTPQPDEIALGKLAFVVGQRLLVPLIDPKKDPRDLVLHARDLSREKNYREQRREFYLWQETTVDALVRGRKTVDGAVDELKKKADEINGSVMRYFADHWESLTAKTVLTVVGISLPFMLGVHGAAGLFGLVPGAFELVKFGALEVMEPMTKEKCEAAAVLVSAKKALG